MTLTNLDRLEENGVAVVSGVLDDGGCAGLLNEVIRAFSSSDWSYVHQGNFRAHCPLGLTPAVEQLLRVCVRHAYPALNGCLRRRQRLVELSSITVFPNARAQQMHADENEPGKHIVSVFVNLAPTAQGVGALCVVPGTHRGEETGASPQILELPAGSAVFMNGKLHHAGTENSSADRIRPVVYFSFGDDDINGPAYSIRPEYRGKFELSNFYLRPPDDTSTPRFANRCWASLKLEPNSETRTLLLMTDSAVAHIIPIGAGERWLVELFEVLGNGVRPTSVEELVQRLSIGRGMLLDSLVKFGDLGILTW